MVPSKSGNLPSTSATPTKVTVNPIFEWPESTGNFSAAKPTVATNDSNQPIVRRRSISNPLFQNARILPTFFSFNYLCQLFLPLYRQREKTAHCPLSGRSSRGTGQLLAARFQLAGYSGLIAKSKRACGYEYRRQPPSGRQLLHWDYFRLARHPTRIAD